MKGERRPAPFAWTAYFLDFLPSLIMISGKFINDIFCDSVTMTLFSELLLSILGMIVSRKNYISFVLIQLYCGIDLTAGLSF